MTLEQTVTIPADQRLRLDFNVPFIQAGEKARILIFPVTDTPKSNSSLSSIRGSCKGLDTMDAYFERKQANKTLEQHAK